MYKIFGEVRLRGFWDVWTRTVAQTYKHIFTTEFCTPPGGEVMISGLRTVSRRRRAVLQRRTYRRSDGRLSYLLFRYGRRQTRETVKNDVGRLLREWVSDWCDCSLRLSDVTDDAAPRRAAPRAARRGRYLPPQLRDICRLTCPDKAPFTSHQLNWAELYCTATDPLVRPTTVFFSFSAKMSRQVERMREIISQITMAGYQTRFSAIVLVSLDIGYMYIVTKYYEEQTRLGLCTAII